VAVGNERSHAAAPGQHQSVAVVAFGVLIAACQRNVTGKAQGVGLLAHLKRRLGARLSGVACRLVDPP
jgi:hypothetical protein